MKKNWVFRCITALATVGLVATMAWGAGLFDRADQDIYGNWEFYNDVTFEDDIILTDATITATGKISATHIANVVREIYLPMAGWAVDGGDDLDEGTAPDIGDDDNIPSITWDNSGETGAIQQTFRLPITYVDGLTIYCMISSDTDASDQIGLDWRIWVNGGSVAFDATAIEQAAVAGTINNGLDTSHEVLTLTLNATGETALSAGCWVTVDVENDTSHASANLELKGTHGTFNATM